MSPNNTNFKYVFKYILIGDAGVGKSCLLLQFTDKTFSERQESTIGVEYGSKIVTVDDQNIKLQIWDTAGQECFKSITRSYYRQAAGALLVYDITRRDSFNHLNRWIHDVEHYAHPTMTICLIGNKTDLTSRQVSVEEGRQFAQQHNFSFYETSAKTAHNIQGAFLKLTNTIYKEITSEEIDFNNTRQGVKFYLTPSSSHTIEKNDQKDATAFSIFTTTCCSTL